MKITMPVAITAADSESRIIAGRIVSWNAEGNTSAGRTMFEKDSIKMAKNIKLVLQHDTTRPLGKLMSYEEDATGITAEFKIAKTTAGNDALEEAATGLRSDFSVGVDVEEWDNKDGVMAISASNLIEVSLVTDGAIPGAEVVKVAAEDTEVSETTQEETQSTIEGEQVSNTVPEVAPAAETVEAAKVEVKAATAPYISTTVRNPIVDKASYLEHSVRASLGSEESKMYVAAAADTTDNAGLVPTRQLTEVINGISNADRPFIDSITRGALPDAGMTFEIPKITVAPTVAVASEGGTPSETDQNAAFVSVNVQKFIGQQTFSLELLDRSSPAFFAELVRQMEFAYAKATDAAVGTALITGGTDGGNRAALTTGALVSDFVSDAAVSIYKGTLGFAENIVVSPEQWGALMGLVDSSNRPIFQQTINPQNAGGNLTATAVRGNLLGLNLRVSRALTDTAGLGDNTLIVVNPDAYTWYESPRLSLQTNLISTGQVQVGYYGYGAIATKLGAGAYRYMVS
jgi:HK97 family phage prohead protease/HK97 family phage major capsid protein